MLFRFSPEWKSNPDELEENESRANNTKDVKGKETFTFYNISKRNRTVDISQLCSDLQHIFEKVCHGNQASKQNMCSCLVADDPPMRMLWQVATWNGKWRCSRWPDRAGVRDGLAFVTVLISCEVPPCAPEHSVA